MNRPLVASMIIGTLAVGVGLGAAIDASLTAGGAAPGQATCVATDLATCADELNNVAAIVRSAATSATTTTLATTTTAPTTTTTLPTSGVKPLGVPGTWTQNFGDEFNGTTLDRAKWNTSGSFLGFCGGRCQRRPDGSYQNGELEYMTDGNNLTFAGGAMTVTAKRETAPNGGAWTSGQVVSKQAFTYGYFETRATFPALKGFQPAFWTWAIQGNNALNHDETDGYEFYSDNHGRIYLTSHAGSGGGCQGLALSFDPTTAMHVYGVNIQPDGTSWYIDGKPVCVTGGHPTAGGVNLIDYLAVLNSSRAPVADPSTMSETHAVDYIRAWLRG